MHPALSFQFERTVHEYARWLSVTPDRRSAAPAWWWGPALALRGVSQPLPPAWCDLLRLPPEANCRAGAELLLEALTPQIAPTWPDEFPLKYQPLAAPS